MKVTKDKADQVIEAMGGISALKFLEMVADGTKSGTVSLHDAAIVTGVACFVAGKLVYGDSFGEGLGLYIDVPEIDN